MLRAHFGEGVVAGGEQGPYLGGSTWRAGPRGFVLAEERPDRAVGGALAWATSRRVSELHVLVTDDGGVAARRAAYFTQPPQVWAIDGTALSPAQPRPLEAPAPLAPHVVALAPVIRRAGAEAVVEAGMLVAEVDGLEVGRVTSEDGTAVLRVGVGKHDRSAHAELPGRDPVAALAQTVQEVRRHRLAGRSGHPADQLAPERWLRSALVRHPREVGARRLQPVPVPFPPHDLRERLPAPAAGEDDDGEAIVVVCSVGIDTELVPAGADIRALHPARLVFAVPEGDQAPVTTTLTARLVQPADVRAVRADWRDLLLGAPPVP